MDEKQQAIYETMLALDTETAVNVLLNHHGTQLLTEALYGDMVDDGYVYVDSDE